MNIFNLERLKDSEHKDNICSVADQILSNIEANGGIDNFCGEIKEIFKNYVSDEHRLNELYGAIDAAFNTDEKELNIKLFFEDKINQFVNDVKRQKELMGEIVILFKKNELVPFLAQENSNWLREIYKDFSFKDLKCYYLLFPIYKALDNKEWSCISKQEFIKIVQETLKSNWWIWKNEQLLSDTKLSSVVAENQEIKVENVVDSLIRIIRIFLWDLYHSWKINTISDLYNIIDSYY